MASMWIGIPMLVVINLPLVRVWVSLLRVPYRLLFPAILIFCAIGYVVRDGSLARSDETSETVPPERR